MSVLLIVFWAFSSLTIFITFLLTQSNIQLSQLLKDAFEYGKVREKRRKWTIMQYTEVPKRHLYDVFRDDSWFSHFYLIGSVINGAAFCCITLYYVFDWPANDILSLEYETFCDSFPRQSIGGESVVLLAGLMFIQDMRRLAECWLVSVYSKSTMNIMHYMLGIVFYASFHISVICEAPPPTATHAAPFPWAHLGSWCHILGLALFLWASWEQHKVTVKFANMRKNKQGSVYSYEHQIPRGGWFSLISCPHYFFEMAIYVSFLTITNFQHITLWSVLLFVIVNQTVAGWVTHQWYKKSFSQYPPTRRAVIPFAL